MDWSEERIGVSWDLRFAVRSEGVQVNRRHVPGPYKLVSGPWRAHDCCIPSAFLANPSFEIGDWEGTWDVEHCHDEGFC